MLFAPFLDDIVGYMAKRYNGLSLLCQVVNNTLSDDIMDVYLKLFVL